MEEALRIDMPTTSADLQAASKSVSSWIASVATVEDYGERMERLDALVEGLKQGVRERQRGSHENGVKRQDGTSGNVRGPEQAPVRQPAPEAAGDAGVTTHDASTVDGATPTARIAGTDTPPTDRGDASGIVEDEVLKEHPDDERRRKKREAEIEKRKRMRQAVLGRKNRGRER